MRKVLKNMNNKKTKRMSIEDLALSMNRGFKSVNKKIDNVTDLVDKLAVSTAKGFESVDKRFDAVDKKIDTKVEELKSQIAGVDNRIDDISMNRVKYEDHNKLKTRVDFIEEKLEKTK